PPHTHLLSHRPKTPDGSQRKAESAGNNPHSALVNSEMPSPKSSTRTSTDASSSRGMVPDSSRKRSRIEANAKQTPKAPPAMPKRRSEERRVGKECRSWGDRSH